MTKTTINSKNTFLFVLCQNEDLKKTQALIAIIKAYIYSKFSQEIEYLGEQAVVFSTKHSADAIKEKINRYKVPYILIDIGVAYDLEAINGVLPTVQIEMLKKISNNQFSDNKPILESLREKAAQEENYEKATVIRDLINKKAIKNYGCKNSGKES